MNKPIKDLTKFREQFVTWTLRRASFRWPPRGEALKLAAVGAEKGYRWCADCKQQAHYKEVKVDHIEPVVNVQSVRSESTSASSAEHLGHKVLRMFPDTTGFQILCGECHARKTTDENTKRKEARIAAKLVSVFVTDATEPGEGSSGPKRRRRKVTMGSPPVEGSSGIGEGIDIRSTEVLTEWVAFCTRCQEPLSGSLTKTPICPKCGGSVVFREWSSPYRSSAL